jgi:hypothetical protein
MKPNQVTRILLNHFDPSGWEDLTVSTDRKEARADLRAYRINDTTTAHRLIKRRELNLPSFVRDLPSLSRGGYRCTEEASHHQPEE